MTGDDVTALVAEEQAVAAVVEANRKFFHLRTPIMLSMVATND